jgi:hypothetical protein
MTEAQALYGSLGFKPIGMSRSGPNSGPNTGPSGPKVLLFERELAGA